MFVVSHIEKVETRKIVTNKQHIEQTTIFHGAECEVVNRNSEEILTVETLTTLR